MKRWANRDRGNYCKRCGVLVTVTPTGLCREICFTDLPDYAEIVKPRVKTTRVWIVQPLVLPMGGSPACRETSRGRSVTHLR